MTGKPQCFVTPSGDEMVVLSRAEYEALLTAADQDEDAEDIALYDARKAALANADATMPAEVSRRMLAGATRLRAIRDWRDVTQMYLSFKTGLAQGYLSDIETGRKAGSAEALEKIAAVLDVPVDWIS